MKSTDKEEVDSKYLSILEERSAWLACLESAGVDNWVGYEMAQEFLEDLKEKRIEVY